MIAKSDLLIVVLSATALMGGIYRWQLNTNVVPAVTIPASSRAEPARSPPAGRLQGVARADAGEAARNQDRPVVRRLPSGGDASVDSSGDASSIDTAKPAIVVEARTAPDGIVVGGDEPAATAGDAAHGIYRVRSGDYLGRIAQRFGTSVSTLRRLNGLQGSTILVGQELKYPKPAD